ncbi:hypothetical protein [Albirhodobacter sp. R86504]|jgi:hypothetical protein|uniref:hypothetical protein n=1 Tax=Albirhodobacter sp. R86504 TaxID=3093848 RepID=UPI0036720AAC
MTSRPVLFRHLRLLAILFLVVTVIIHLYADDADPMPVSTLTRLLIAAGILIVVNLPFVKAIGRIFLNTTPDDGPLDD